MRRPDFAVTDVTALDSSEPAAPQLQADDIDRCAGLAPTHPVVVLRQRRPEARGAAQAAFDALWLPVDGGSRVAHERSLVALRVAALLEDAALVEACHQHARMAGASPAQLARVMPAAENDSLTVLDARLTALLSFVDRITMQPATGTARHLDLLARLGFEPAAIVGLAQAASVMAVLARVLAGVRALAAAGDRFGSTPIDAAVAGRHVLPPAPALRGRFTLDGLDWRPWLPAVDPAQASTAQQALLAQLSPAARRSPFELTLLHVPTLRQPLAQLIAHASRAPGGLPWADRALTAVAVSRLDGCTYGASTLGRIVSRLTRDSEVIGRLFAQGVNLPLGARQRALVDLAVDLAAPRPALAAARIEALRAVACSELEILDAIHAAAMAAGDDRLALTLGEARAAGQA